MIPDALPPCPPARLPAELADAELADTALAHAAAHAWTHAPFLRAQLRRRPETLARLAAHGFDDAIAAIHAVALDAAQPLGQRLRRARCDLALTVALADLSATWDLEAVTHALSDFADLALDQAIRAAIAERVPGADAIGFTALALGKLGSRELNYSSDIDLILLHDRATLPRRTRDDPDEAAVRIGRRVVELLQARDADGYVARVDLRLRPSPEVTPIVLPVEAATSYYHAEAEPWERAAFIRARVVAGDRALGSRFLAEVAPFVWRRSLDFQAIREVRAVSLRIRDHYDACQRVGPGFDFKRGRGGIREIEFFAQTHQMIFGGRDPSLRAPATQQALAALEAAGRIAPAEAATLSRAYRYLRAAEHRAQMVDDAQTHAVPEQAAARDNYARFSGYAHWNAMAVDVARVTGAVAPIFDQVAEPAAAATVPRDPAQLAAWLEALGLPPGEEPARLVAGWREGSRRALRSPAARTAFETVLPDLARAFAAADDPRAALVRFDRFLDQLPSGVQFLSLLAANPPLTGLLGRMLSTAPVLADALARRPDLFDVLLDAGAFAAIPSASALEAELCADVARARGEEEVLDRVRRWTGERRFQLGAQLVEGRTDPLDAARGYAGLADAALRVLADTTSARFEAQHGRIPGGRLIVLAFGRYGGETLTARSDLDLVYLHSGAADAVADGPRAAPASLHFARLAQRLTAALSVPTAAGALYDIDTRLRPQGAKGPLVAPVEAFARYQRDEAWTWEHMALTRARVVVGAPEDRAEVEAAIADVLGAPRDAAKLVEDARSIRAEMDRHRPGGELLEVKLGPGGLIDLEFVVHVEQLRAAAHLTPDLGRAARALEAAGLVPAGLGAAHDLLTRVLVMIRLVDAATHGPLAEMPSAACQLLARATGHGEAGDLRAAIGRAKTVVREAWASTFGARREQ